MLFRSMYLFSSRKIHTKFNISKFVRSENINYWENNTFCRKCALCEHVDTRVYYYNSLLLLIHLSFWWTSVFSSRIIYKMLNTVHTFSWRYNKHEECYLSQMFHNIHWQYTTDSDWCQHNMWRLQVAFLNMINSE